MKTVLIACEGAQCNAGHSADAREAASLYGLPTTNDGTRDDALKFARQFVTRQLAVTPHEKVGACVRAATLFGLYACLACGHERVYGNSTL